MSFADAHQTKERIRQANDIVDVVGSSIELRRSGRVFLGLCPWHDDSRPSLRVDPERQSWKCYVCNLGGDVFSYVMQREQVGFREALQILADRAGVVLQSAPAQAAVAPGSPDHKPTLYAAMAWAEAQYHQCLLQAAEAAPAREYLRQRGISQESIDKFHLGFAPEAWQWLRDRAQTTPYHDPVLQAVGLVGVSQKTGRSYEPFKGRLLFPIRDTQDRCIAFGGRALPHLQQPGSGKYVNSPETRLFSKSEQVYGLNLARHAISQAKEIVVVEGYTDVIMAHQAGVERVVAVLGVALNDRHIRLLKRFADNVVLVLDGDTAGQKRANEILELFVRAQVNLRILTLPEGLDPCDFCQRQGGPAFEQLLKQSVDALEHRIRVATRGIDLIQDTHAAHLALEQILATMAKAPPVGLREDQILARLAREFRVPAAKLRTRIDDLRTAGKKRERIASPADGLEEQQRTGGKALDLAQREVLELLMLHEDLAEPALQQIQPEDLPPGPARRIYQVIQELYQQQEPTSYDHLMLVIEDPSLKALLAELVETAEAKEKDAQEEPSERLRGITQRFGDQARERTRQQRMAVLEKQDLNDEEELSLLQQMIEEQRNRQGISAPTDG